MLTPMANPPWCQACASVQVKPKPATAPRAINQIDFIEASSRKKQPAGEKR
jgi:hypothetical protein